MKLRNKSWLIIIGVIVVGLIVAKLTGVCQGYRLPTTSMEPTIQMDQLIIATNLRNAKRNDIVLFNRTVNEAFENDVNGERYVFCSRLIAQGEDTITIKDGYAYVNGQLADDTTKLKFGYTLLTKDFQNLLTLLEIEEASPRVSNDFSSFMDTSHAFLSYDEYIKAKILIPLRKTVIDLPNSLASVYKGTNWTMENFGPYVVPPNFLFMMGDNRDLSYDSRLHGPIPVKDCKGILIMKILIDFLNN